MKTNHKPYNYKNFEFSVNGEPVIITAWSTNTRNGFTHQCDSIDFPEVTKSRICYINRTWERFDYESVLKSYCSKLPKAIAETILKQINHYAEIEAMKAQQSAEAFARAFERLTDKSKERIKRIFPNGINTEAEANNAQMAVNFFGMMEAIKL